MVRSQASILTESQRKYLFDGTTLDDEPVSNPSEYRKNIRRRVAQTLADLNLLFREFDQEELRLVFSEPMATIKETRDENGDSHKYCQECGKFVESVEHDCPGYDYESNWYSMGPGAFAFLVWALNVSDEPLYPPYDEQQPAFENFEELAEIGVSKYLMEEHNLTADVSVSIELSNVDRLDELYPSE